MIVLPLLQHIRPVQLVLRISASEGTREAQQFPRVAPVTFGDEGEQRLESRLGAQPAFEQVVDPPGERIAAEGVVGARGTRA